MGSSASMRRERGWKPMAWFELERGDVGNPQLARPAAHGRPQRAAEGARGAGEEEAFEHGSC
jgi:hypothetical protein